MAISKKTKAEVTNIATFNIYEERFKHLALNLFEWSGLPESIPSYYIERTLYRDGKILFFSDSRYGFMALPCGEVGGVNPYGEYLKYRATGFNYNKEYTVDNSVCIWNNPSKSPTEQHVQYFADKIMRIERSIDVNLNVTRIPWIFKGNGNNLLSLKNIYAQVERNEPVIYLDNKIADDLDVLETPSIYLCDKFADLRHDYINEVATFFGIKNANTDKRERLITDEVNANNEFTEYNVDFMLECRKIACDKINKMFGLNINVEVKIKDEGVDDNGYVHNRTVQISWK